MLIFSLFSPFDFDMIQPLFFFLIGAARAVLVGCRAAPGVYHGPPIFFSSPTLLNSKMWTRHQILIPSVNTNSNGYASVGKYKPYDASQYFVYIVANWHSTKMKYGISGNLMFLMGEPNTTYSEVSIDCWY